jgi:tRNA(Ile)-lysidine synthase
VLPELPDFDWSLVADNETILVATSGGADSQTLLWALHENKRQIVAAHVNHGWRGEASDNDEQFVMDFCVAHHIKKQSVRVSCARSEDAARVARYDALLNLARENSCTRIALGHTATDSLETHLLNLARGASVEGLAGIPPSRLVEDILLVRPLWRTPRETVRRALEISGWPHVEDESNASPEFARNRIRALLPQLGNVETIARSSARSGEILRDDIACLDEIARAKIEDLKVRSISTVLALDGDGFRALHIALQRRVLREAARRFGFVPNSEPIEAVRRHVAANGKRIVWCWEKGVRCEWTGEASGNRIRLWRVGDG